MTPNAEEMIDLRNIVHLKSIHLGLDCITDGPIGGGPEILDKEDRRNVSRAKATLRYLPPPPNQMNDSAQKVNFVTNTIPNDSLRVNLARLTRYGYYIEVNDWVLPY